MENKTKNIMLVMVVSVLSFMLLFSDKGFLQSAYAIEITDYTITTGAQVQQISNILYTYNDSTGAFRKIDTSDGTTLVSTTIDIAGGFYPSFVDFRCNSANCWIMYDNSATHKFYIARISGTTGTVAQNQTYSGQTGQAQYGGLALGDTTIFFTRECATTDIGSSGAGDTDYALFSIDGNSMSGTPVQHTDCGTNFTPISPTGRVSYMKVNTNEDRLGFISDSVALAFKWVDLDQAFSASQNTILCTGTPTEIDMDKFNGNNIQFIDNTAYLLENSGTDDYTIDVFSSTCSLTAFAGIIDEFNTSQANGLGLDTTNGIFYVGGTQADGTGLTIVGRNFTGNTITNTILAQYYPSDTGTSQGFTYIPSLDQSSLTTSSIVYKIEYGNSVPPSPNEEFCAQPENANILICRLDNNSGALTGASNMLNQSGTNIICQIGLLHCTQEEDGNFTPDDPNIQTNGVGYLLVIILMGVFVGLLWVASRGQIQEIPTFIWFIGTLAILGASTAFGWIDPTFLILGAITIIALAVAKVKGVFGGQQTFAGELS